MIVHPPILPLSASKFVRVTLLKFTSSKIFISLLPAIFEACILPNEPVEVDEPLIPADASTLPNEPVEVDVPSNLFCSNDQ